jgi:hypothetical protein
MALPQLQTNAFAAARLSAALMPSMVARGLGGGVVSFGRAYRTVTLLPPLPRAPQRCHAARDVPRLRRATSREGPGG